jgi:hypothetical protein
VKSCGPDATMAGVSSQDATSVFAKTATSKPNLAGASTKQAVKPSRRESRIAPVTPVVLPPCFLLHGTHGCDRHPAFPAPSPRSGERYGHPRARFRAARSPRGKIHRFWLQMPRKCGPFRLTDRPFLLKTTPARGPVSARDAFRDPWFVPELSRRTCRHRPFGRCTGGRVSSKPET